MPYEIPQQLQYEEKIIFGLTFKQLIYAIVFGLPALLIIVKTDLSIYLKVFLGGQLIGLACLFMFFNTSSYLLDLISWLRFQEVSLMQPKMIQFLGLEKIHNGVLYVWKTKKPIERKNSRE